MSDTNEVGRNAEGAVRVFLESGGYTVVPYGVEHTLKEAVDKLGYNGFSALNVDRLISSAPDFFVLSPDRKTYWLIEVKCPAQWDENQRRWLKDSLEPQTECWRHIFVVIAHRSGRVTDPLENHIRIGQLFIDDNKLKVWPRGSSESMDWDEIRWEDLPGLETVFGAGREQGSWSKRCSTLVETIQKKPDEAAEKKYIGKRFNELMPRP